MPQTQDDIDGLLAEVSALADEAVATLDEGQPPAPAAAPRARVVEGTVINAVGAVFLPEDASRILEIQVPVIVTLAERTMALSEILSLTTGSIVEFEKAADSELDLMINNKCIGRGQAVKVGENFGLRVTKIGSVVERVRALGPC